jgi:thiamine-monophosphate kinase
MGEFDLIRLIRDRAITSDRVALGIGDDCASLRFTPGYEVLVTTDMLMDGRHFRLGEASPEQIGHKCLGVNLSDIAAMAGTPIAAVVAVALPRVDAEAIALGLHAGISRLAERFGVLLVGGDTNAWDGPLVVSVTVLGEAEPGRAIRRSGAKPGDVIFVTGPLGGSLIGRHLRPEPRVFEALALSRAAVIHAMIDLSDGLSSDLGHILEESGDVGAVLDAESIPIHEDAHLMFRQDGRTPLDHALNDGEDFELCLTAPEGSTLALLAILPRLHRIGRITSEPGIGLRTPDGRLQPLGRRGFDHLSPRT